MDHLEQVLLPLQQGCGLPYGRSSTLCPQPVSRTGKGSPGADTGQGMLGFILVHKANPVPSPCLLPSRTALQACTEVEAQNSGNPGSLCRHYQGTSWQAWEQASLITSPLPKTTVPSLLEAGSQGHQPTLGSAAGSGGHFLRSTEPHNKDTLAFWYSAIGSFYCTHTKLGETWALSSHLALAGDSNTQTLSPGIGYIRLDMKAKLWVGPPDLCKSS